MTAGARGGGMAAVGFRPASRQPRVAPMARRSAHRRLLAALLGLALLWALLTPMGAVAASDYGLPAALAFTCAPADEDGGPAPAAGDHPTCGHCTGPYHGMALALVRVPLLVPPSGPTGFAAAAPLQAPAVAALAYAPRAPPAA